MPGECVLGAGATVQPLPLWATLLPRILSIFGNHTCGEGGQNLRAQLVVHEKLTILQPTLWFTTLIHPLRTHTSLKKHGMKVLEHRHAGLESSVWRLLHLRVLYLTVCPRAAKQPPFRAASRFETRI
jgi:hypothetical protein